MNRKVFPGITPGVFYLFLTFNNFTTGSTMAGYKMEFDEQSGIDRIRSSTPAASIAVKRYGCELVSYRVQDPRTGKIIPVLYRDGETSEPESGWKAHAPVLFPVVGRLKGNRSRLGNVVITSPGNIHGFARVSRFELVGKGEKGGTAYLRYRMEDNEFTRSYYPFRFRFEVAYTLSGNELDVTFKVVNREKSRPMYFCLGWHPGFRTPLGEKGAKTDCLIILPPGRARRYHAPDGRFLSDEITEVKLGEPLEWTEEVLFRTILLELDDRETRQVTLRDPAAGVDINLEFPDFSQLAIWSDPGYDFICIEPWQGMVDHQRQETFDKKLGIIHLEPGETVEKKIVVRPTFH